MTAVLIFGVVLLIAVLLSELAHRSVLSSAVLFLVAGFVCSEGLLGWLVVDPGSPVVERLSELAIIAVLFTDGMKVGARDLMVAWRLPGRAIVFGLPLTLAITAVLCHYINRLLLGHIAFGRRCSLPNRSGVCREHCRARKHSRPPATFAQR